MAEELYRQLLSLTFFVQTEAVALSVKLLRALILYAVSGTRFSEQTPWLPAVLSALGFAATALHLSLYYALYAFEYRWALSGAPLMPRLTQFEEQWPYYAGFGFPAALLTLMFPPFFNAGIFALIFPAFLVLAIVARPIDPAHSNSLPPLPLFKLAKHVNYTLLNAANRRGKQTS